MNKITILSLFCGRWNTWAPYWEGLKSLDYPKNKIQLVWYSNAPEDFLNFLKIKAQYAESLGYKVRLYNETSLKVSDNAHVENGNHPMEHAITIASLYNAALSVCRTDRVFFLEDDVYVPSHSLKKLNKDLEDNKDVSWVAGCVFDRHKPQIFLWDFEKLPVGYTEISKAKWKTFPPSITWGLRPIGMGHLGCTLIDFSRLPKKLPKPIFRPQCNVKGAEHFIGCDIVLCFDIWRLKGKCLADYDVRGYHYDSKTKPH